MKRLEKHLKSVWAIAGMALLLIIVIVVATSGSGTQESTRITEDNHTDTIAEDDTKPDYNNLVGFDLTSNVSDGLYTYSTTHDGQDYSVSLGIGQSLLEQHTTNYPLERTTGPVSSVEVSYGYNLAFEVGDQLIQPEFNSLAFDFDHNGVSHTGEITNLENESAGPELLQVLERFVATVSE